MSTLPSTSPASPGARGSFGAPVVARGGTISLRGVGTDEPALRERLTQMGYQVVTAGGSVLLLGRALDDKQRELLRKSARTAQVVDIEEFLGALDTLTTPGDAPLRASPRRAAVEVTSDRVRILDIELTRRGERSGLVPPASRFRHLCVDETLLRTARAVAAAVRQGFPVVLEGETATAKTTAILWVAHLLGQPVVRLNLNGQTDTSELVGRYVPASGAGAGVTWNFQEGTVPRSLREGHWVLLDEMNLAEPQVLERLNPVLEDPPTLVLSEGAGTTFGPGGDVPVHPDFRLFGTMNPAEYAGRSALSPAFRDRWSSWTFVRPPDEAALRAMLRCLVFGEQPEVALRGVLWTSEAAEPVHGYLRAVPGIDALLDAISTFHAGVSRASGAGDGGASLGRARRERYVFTRRTLLAALKTLAGEIGGVDLHDAGAVSALTRDVLERMYLERISDEADRAAVRTALRAAGFAG